MEQGRTAAIDEQMAKAKSLRYIYTALLGFLLFAVGLQTAAMGPAIVDLTHIYDVGVDTVAILSSVSSVGYCIGAFSSVLFRWFNRQMTCAVFLAVGSICFALLPHAPSIYVAYVLNVFVGMGFGMHYSAQNVWLLEMWHENPNPALELTYTMLGLGLIVGPLIESPYATGDVDDEDSSRIIRITLEERRQNLTVPFAVFSGIMLVGAGIEFFMYFIRRYVPPPKEVLEKSRNSSGNTNETKLFERERAPKILIVVLMALCLGSYTSLEMSFSSFSATFAQYIPLKVSASYAAKIQSAFSATFTAGRACNFFISMKLKPHILLIMHYSVTILSFIAMFFAGESLTLLWITNVTMGYGFSAIWGSTLSRMKNYVIISDTIGGTIVFFCGVLSAFIPYLSSLKIESNPMSFLYINLSIVVVQCLIQIIIQFIIRSEKAKSKSES